MRSLPFLAGSELIDFAGKLLLDSKVQTGHAARLFSQGGMILSEERTKPVQAGEVVVKSGRIFITGSEKWEIRDPGDPAPYVDLLTEARCVNGIVYLGFGSSVLDANNGGIVQIASRLRMNLAAAQFLHKMLGDMISDALKPVEKSKTN